MAPPEIQRAAGCRIGIDYPNPIIDHATAGFLCCEKLRSVMDMVHQGSSSTMATSTRRSHTSCKSVLQTHLSRFHPYSQLEGRAVENSRSDHHQHQLCHHHHGNSGSAQNCTVCTCTDNVLTQVLCTTRAQNRAPGGNRSRKRSPPLLCSHKQSNFSTIT